MSHTCEARGCRNKRSDWGRYCSTHFQREYRFGHPEQPRLKAAQLKPYRKLAANFVARFENHPATKAALILIERGHEVATGWQKKACIRVWQESVPAREVLELALMHYFARHFDPRLYVSDGSLETLIGRSVLHARPVGRNALGRPIILPAPMRRAMGRFLISTLAGFLAGAVKWVEDTYEAEKKLAADLRTPFPVKVEVGSEAV